MEIPAVNFTRSRVDHCASNINMNIINEKIMLYAVTIQTYYECIYIFNYNIKYLIFSPLSLSSPFLQLYICQAKILRSTNDSRQIVLKIFLGWIDFVRSKIYNYQIFQYNPIIKKIIVYSYLKLNIYISNLIVFTFYRWKVIVKLDDDRIKEFAWDSF